MIRKQAPRSFKPEISADRLCQKLVKFSLCLSGARSWDGKTSSCVGFTSSAISSGKNSKQISSDFGFFRVRILPKNVLVIQSTSQIPGESGIWFQISFLISADAEKADAEEAEAEEAEAEEADAEQAEAEKAGTAGAVAEEAETEGAAA